MDLNLIKGSHCFPAQETLLSLLSTGWFKEHSGKVDFNHGS